MKIFVRALFAFYLLLIIKFVVFKDMDMILIGHMRFYFGGTQTGDPNWIPFKTIADYFMGNKGLLITGLNLAGNLALLFPLGFLLPDGFIYLRRAQIFYVAFFTALSIETIQALFKIGIFDVDDVLLNGLGLIGGYFFCIKMPRILRKPCIFLFAAILSFAYLFYVTHSIPMLRQ